MDIFTTRAGAGASVSLTKYSAQSVFHTRRHRWPPHEKSERCVIAQYVRVFIHTLYNISRRCVCCCAAVGSVRYNNFVVDHHRNHRGQMLTFRENMYSLQWRPHRRIVACSSATGHSRRSRIISGGVCVCRMCAKSQNICVFVRVFVYVIKRIHAMFAAYGINAMRTRLYLVWNARSAYVLVCVHRGCPSLSRI